MADEPKDAAAPVDATSSPPPTFADRVNALIDEAIAKGERPLPILASILARRGMGLVDQGRAVLGDMFEQGLARLEGSSARTGKK